MGLKSDGSLMSALQNKSIVLCVTGGIAAFKAVLLLRLLTKAGADVRVIMSRSATQFVGPLTFEALSNHPVLTDLWATGAGGEAHIQLAETAELLAVVPATANTLARMTYGLADDIVSTTLLAAKAPVLVAPAMHTRMYQHPATQENLATLKRRGVHIVEPTVGELASGHGKGRLAEPEQILAHIEQCLTPQDLVGRSVVVTAGPTVEALDPVRFISNPSTGKMGYALARQAARRGAQVTLISGPTALSTPHGVERVDIRSAQELYEAVMARYASADILIKSAAVADYTPRETLTHKLKKGDQTLTLELVSTVDVLAAVGARRKQEGRGPVLIGFAMETRELLQQARRKLEKKGCDLIVANNLKEAGAGFGHETNQVTLVDARGDEALPLMSKDEVAVRILDRALEFLHARAGGSHGS